MRISHIFRTIMVVASLSCCQVVTYGQDSDPLTTVNRVVQKIISDTRFEFKQVPQQEVLGMQVVDARFLSAKPGEIIYALRRFNATTDTAIQFGLNSGCALNIWVNKQSVYRQANSNYEQPHEIAYDRIQFQQRFSANIKKGENEILIQIEKGNSIPIAFLRPINGMGYLDTAISFNTGGSVSWLFTDPIPAKSSIVDPLKPIKAFYELQDKKYTWQSAPQKFIPEIVIDSHAAYQRDPYADWQYSHGIMFWSIFRLAEQERNSAFLEFVEDYISFTVQNVNYFRWQYDSLNAFRGEYHRIFRRSMLDDAGAPVLPFMASYLRGDTTLRSIVGPMIKYVTTQQPRLADGTFCRPEPVEFTVWCDDLFMSVPLLLQIAKLTGEQKFYDDAARQAVNFRNYLQDSQTRLYKHGWFSTTGKPSPIYWGRANGWIAWAMAELLEQLPVKHPMYKTILNDFRQYMEILVHYQASDGMWHQVLDNPESYKETSCTAMFVVALAKGVRLGWLPSKYGEQARKGWNAVASHISDDGVVHGICRGTDMGYDEKFYMERKTIDNDPRGLGGVITAGMEMGKLNGSKNRK